MSSETQPSRQLPFARPDISPRFGTLRGVNRAVYTLFVTPQHDKLHRDIADRMQHDSQPLHPSLDQTVNEIQTVASQLVDTSKIRTLKGRELAKLGGVLIQFTDYMPTLQPYAQTPYRNIKNMYDGVVDHAAQKREPLTFADQLHVALQQTEGDLPESLWRLFLTSRLYGRWLDGNVISDMPEYTRDEKLTMMLQWQQSLAACKVGENGAPQDVGGDTYYAWTHALAAVAYGVLPEKPSRKTKMATRTFERGTEFMHKIVHSVNPQAVVNDHSTASEYGNAIGKICADILSK